MSTAEASSEPKATASSGNPTAPPAAPATSHHPQGLTHEHAHPPYLVPYPPPPGLSGGPYPYVMPPPGVYPTMAVPLTAAHHPQGAAPTGVPPMPPLQTATKVMKEDTPAVKAEEDSVKKDDVDSMNDGDDKDDEKKEGGLDLLASLALPNKQPPPPSNNSIIESIDISTTSKKTKKKNPRTEDLATKEKLYVEKVRDCDVLCGRGGKSNHHAGNKKYRQVVSEMKRTYQSTGAKTAKTDLSRAIVEHVVGYGGRFIKRDEANGKYFLLTKAQARRKTSQALRETKELKWTM